MNEIELTENEFLAIKVEQPFGSYYSVKLHADFLLERAYSKSADIVDNEMSGAQRRITNERISDIRSFIDSEEASFPNAIIIAANYDESDVLVEEDDRWKVEAINEKLSLYKLVIPSDKKICSVVDGQHRLFSFEGAKNKSMELNCALYLDLVPSLQASVFATINFNQKPVDKSLAYNLFGYQLDNIEPSSWSPDLLAVNLCRYFSEDAGSFFYHHINYRLAKRNVPKGFWVISTASFVDGIVSLISKNPKDDRYKINKKGVFGVRGRKALVDDRSYALRQAYIDENDEAIKQVVAGFFSALQANFQVKDTDKHILVSTIGIKALFSVLNDILKQKGVSKTTVTSFEKLLKKTLTIKYGDRDFFSSSTKGQKRLYNCLHSKVFDVPIDQLVPMEELPQYRAALGMS